MEQGAAVSEDAKQWAGWGTALKPAFEPIIIARTPIPETTVANVLEHGTGAINVKSGRFGEGKWPTNVALEQSQADALDALTGSWDEQPPVSARFPIFRFEAKPGTQERPRAFGVSHATVKPLGLMRWLVELLTPPGGRVLEPFAGSGTTVEAALQSGFTVTAIERDESYVPLIESRLDRWETTRVI